MVTNREDVDRIVRKLRNHGSDKRSCHSVGYNSRLDDIQAAVLSAKLKHIDDWNALRRKWSARYTAGLKDASQLTLPYEMPGYYHVFHLYVVETKQAEQRDPLLDFLIENGIDAKCHYPIAIHQQEGYPWGKEARIAGPGAELGAQRGLLHLAAHVPGADRGGSGLRDRRRCWSGTGRQVAHA